MTAARFDREGDRRWVVLFDSIHHVLSAERGLKQHGFRHELVPVPKELSADCGMAIEVRAADGPAILDFLNAPDGRWREVYVRSGHVWRPVGARPASDGDANA